MYVKQTEFYTVSISLITQCLFLTLVLRLGIKKRSLSNFANHKKIPVWYMAPPFRDFSWKWSGYTIKQPGRQSVHRKFIGVTSNTCGFLKNWQHYLMTLTFDLEGQYQSITHGRFPI